MKYVNAKYIDKFSFYEAFLDYVAICSTPKEISLLLEHVKSIRHIIQVFYAELVRITDWKYFILNRELLYTKYLTVQNLLSFHICCSSLCRFSGPIQSIHGVYLSVRVNNIYAYLVELICNYKLLIHFEQITFIIK